MESERRKWRWYASARPLKKNGNLGFLQLRRAIEEITLQLPRRKRPLIVIRSASACLAMRSLLLGLTALGLFAQPSDDLATVLAPSRQRTNHIHDQTVKLRNKRAAEVREVGVIKDAVPCCGPPGRSEQVLCRVSEQARASVNPPMPCERIYQTVVSELTSMEEREMAR